MRDMDNLKALCYKVNEYDEIGSTIDHKDNIMSTGTRNTNRKLHYNQLEINHSNNSVLTTMELFVNTINNMNETILVPCRLMDIKFYGNGNGNDNNNKIKIKYLKDIDLYQFYNILNNIKNDLMWGNGNKLKLLQSVVSTTTTTGGGTTTPPTTNIINSHNNEIKGHVRRSSTVSSTSSMASDEFLEINDDSGIEEEYSQQMFDTFHLHLDGLQNCLKELILISNDIITRYNNDIEGI